MALSGRVSALPKAGSIGTELGKLGREMLVIPAQLWMLLAELAGTVALVAWRRIAWPLYVRPERASGAKARREPEAATGLLARNAPEARA
jgi:hypothetical protein